MEPVAVTPRSYPYPCYTLCVSIGIKYQWTVPSTSAQNGHVKCFHYTQFNSAWTMQAASKLPPNRWDKFIFTATYLQMQITMKSLHNMTPYKTYHKQKPDISHLCEIGCHTFILILNKHNPKMFQCLEEHVLISYGRDSKMYHCYHWLTHKVVESYCITFIESKDKCKVPFQPCKRCRLFSISINHTFLGFKKGFGSNVRVFKVQNGK